MREFFVIFQIDMVISIFSGMYSERLFFISERYMIASFEKHTENSN